MSVEELFCSLCMEAADPFCTLFMGGGALVGPPSSTQTRREMKVPVSAGTLTQCPFFWVGASAAAGPERPEAQPHSRPAMSRRTHQIEGTFMRPHDSPSPVRCQHFSRPEGRASTCCGWVVGGGCSYGGGKVRNRPAAGRRLNQQARCLELRSDSSRRTARRRQLRGKMRLIIGLDSEELNWLIAVRGGQLHGLVGARQRSPRGSQSVRLVDHKARYDTPERPAQVKLKVSPFTVELRSGAMVGTMRKSRPVNGAATLVKDKPSARKAAYFFRA